ncbi:MAG: GIY-YIG nuclease family protein [Chloroflexota bacterium]
MNRPRNQYSVYILASRSRRLYIGMTGDPSRRVTEHKSKAIEGFTGRYNIDRLVWFEQTASVTDAIDRERQLKRWRREKKITLVEMENPGWCDLAAEW